MVALGAYTQRTMPTSAYNYVTPLANSDVTFDVVGTGLDLSPGVSVEWVQIDLDDDWSRRWGDDNHGTTWNFINELNTNFTDSIIFSASVFNSMIQDDNQLTMSLSWGYGVDPRGATDDLNWTFSYDSAAPVPEPATMLLMGTGLAGLIGARRKKKK